MNRINISLDTLKPDRFKEITRVGRIEKVFEGIAAVKAAGISPVKINVVIIRGFNDDEIVPLSEWALQNSLHIRFIEFMPMNDSSLSFNEKFLSSADIKKTVFSHFADLKPCSISGCGPSESWCLDGTEGSIGLIEAVSHSFCGSCNRLRLTADGKLKPCLFSNDEVDLLHVLRSGDSNRRAVLTDLFAAAVRKKPESHGNFRRVNNDSRCMNEIGG